MIGLDEIMTELYSEGRQPDKQTAEEILDRLEENKNYIPASARREYGSVILKQYRDYMASRKENIP